MIIPSEQITTEEIKSWKGLHLLHFQASSCSQKVRIMLGELGVDWQSHPVNLIKQQNATPWFLGINPRGVVPVLVHDGVVHVESNDIIAYLNSCYRTTENSLFFEPGSQPAEEAQEFLDLEDSLHMDLRLLTIQFGPLSVKSKDQIDAQEKNGAPDEKRTHEINWWREKAANGISDSDTCESCRNFETAFTRLDSRLADEHWLMGDRISIVDISWFANIQRLVAMGYPLARHHRLNAYYQRLISRTAFQAELRHPGARAAKVLFGGIKLMNRFKGRSLENCLAS